MTTRRRIPWQRRLRHHAVAHWRGELTVATSLWLHLLLPGALASLLLSALTVQLSVRGGLERLTGLLFVLVWPLALALVAWGAVGTWRAASVRLSLRQRPAQQHAVRAGVALVVAGVATYAVLQQVPVAWAAARLLAGTDPLGHATLAPAGDGQRLRLSGHLGIGDAARLQGALAAAPPARVLELDLTGGRFPEARALAAQLRGQGWLTRVVGECRNACATLFLAGQWRQLMPGSHLGFNRAGADHVQPLTRWWARRQLADTLREAGLPPVFVMKTLITPSARVWHPGLDELQRERFVSAPERPLDLELPRAATAREADYDDALRAHPLWESIEARFPGTRADALQRLMTARAAGADDDALQVAAQEALEPLIGRLLFNAEHDLREPFAALLLDQIAALPDRRACRELLGGDAAMRRALPVALARREAAWLSDALIEPPRTSGPRRATGPEHEVIRRTLGEQAPAALARLRRPAPQDDRACERAATLLGEALALPPAERKLALRLAFESP
ncbi:MAG: hypothetical protein U1F56_07090 [Rubrivivax sp.]